MKVVVCVVGNPPQAAPPDESCTVTRTGLGVTPSGGDDRFVALPIPEPHPQSVKRRAEAAETGPAEPLWISANGRRAFSETLARRARAGQLAQVARGVYCSLDLWLRSAPWDRYLLAVVAHARSRRREVVFCHQTAVVLHGLPTAVTPTEIHTHATSPGGARRTAARSPYEDVLQAFQAAELLRRTGVRLARGRLPMPPPVRARWNLFGQEPCVAGFDVIPVRLSDGRLAGHVLANPLPWACAALFATDCLVDALATADALHRQDRRQFGETERLLGDLPLTPAGRRRGLATLSLADPRAESPKESTSRALIHRLGFEAPGLQHSVTDVHGRELARGDFWWKHSTLRPRQLLGEFDGLWKYGVDLSGPDGGAAALEREKKRELMLARRGYDTVHWINDDLRRPATFGKLLADHGVPLR